MTTQQFHLHHVSIMVSNTDTALQFYSGTLGLKQIERPDLPFPGAWLEVGKHQQIHLLELPNPDADSERPEHGGRDRHFAMIIPDLDVFKSTLEAASIPYSISKSGRRALFCRDPDNNAVELIEKGVLPGTDTIFD